MKQLLNKKGSQDENIMEKEKTSAVCRDCKVMGDRVIALTEEIA